MTDLIRILIAEDHIVVREGLCALLIPRNGMQVVGEAADGSEAVEKARALQPDVILMDLNMPGKSGLEAIGEITREDPEARILVLTSYGEDANVAAAIKAGALGYMLKNSSAEELFAAIRSVARGNLSLSPSTARALVQGLREPGDQPPSSISTLTERELEVLRCLAQGLSNQEIAEILKVEKTTARSHVSRVLSKLDVANRTQAALYAIEMGLGPPKDES